MMRKLPTTVRVKFRRGTSNIEFGYFKVYVYGKTKQSVAQAIEQFLLLKDDSFDAVCIGVYSAPEARTLVPTTFISSRFLAEYTKVNPHRRLCLGCGCELSVEESVALASHPEPLNVGLECSFADQGRTFVEALAKRTTHFGTIAVSKRSYDNLYTMYSFLEPLCDVKSALSNIALEANDLVFEGPKCLLPLSLPTRQLEYHVRNTMQMGEIESLVVVSQAVTLVFDYSLPAQFHTLFLQASGNLQELGLVYDYLRPPSVQQQQELLQAIRTNHKLCRLELGCVSADRASWQDLLEVIASHSGLRTVVFRVRHYGFELENVRTLVPFAQKNVHVDISVNDRALFPKKEGEVMRAILAPLRLINGAKALTRESNDDRPALFGVTLTIRASSDFSKLYPVLILNADLLCTMLDDLAVVSEPRHTRKRQRQL